jgi:hypothetical protein
VYGNYTALPPAPTSVPAFAFTDNPDQDSNGWLLIEVETEGHPRLKARRPKVLPFNYLPQYERVVWTDASITITDQSFPQLFASSLDNTESVLAALPHPDRDCVYDEIAACMSLEKYRSQYAALKHQDAEYHNMNYPAHNGLWATTVIAWKNEQGAEWIGRNWWASLNAYTDADQVSLPFLLHQFHTTPVVPPFNLMENDYFKWVNVYDR